MLLAHLSDPHLSPLPKPRVAELIGKRVLGFANWQRRRLYHRTNVLEAIVADVKAASPDHIAVTGDLVNIALEAEFAPAQRWLHALGTPHDVTLVPGNHDAYVGASVPLMLRHWSDYMRSDPDALAERGHFPFLRRRGGVALIGLSTAVPTAPFMATGLVGGEQLLRLGAILGRLAAEQAFRIVLIHHAPVLMSSRHKRLVDADAFRRVIAEHGAELILHGHHHVHSLGWLDGPRARVAVLGVPSASAGIESDEDPAAYNLYSIDGGPGAWRCEAVSRGLKRGHDGVVELARRTL